MQTLHLHTDIPTCTTVKYLSLLFDVSWIIVDPDSMKHSRQTWEKLHISLNCLFETLLYIPGNSNYIETIIVCSFHDNYTLTHHTIISSGNKWFHLLCAHVLIYSSWNNIYRHLPCMHVRNHIQKHDKNRHFCHVNMTHVSEICFSGKTRYYSIQAVWYLT